MHKRWMQNRMLLADFSNVWKSKEGKVFWSFSVLGSADRFRFPVRTFCYETRFYAICHNLYDMSSSSSFGSCTNTVQGVCKECKFCKSFVFIISNCNFITCKLNLSLARLSCVLCFIVWTFRTFQNFFFRAHFLLRVLHFSFPCCT